MNEITDRRRFWTRLHQWAYTHKVTAYLLTGGGILLAVGLTAFTLFYQKPAPAPAPVHQAAKPVPKPVVYYSLLNGEQVPDKAALIAPVTAIMIENSPSARPQSGLKDAGVVYEAIAEGGITRFMALYQQAKPQLIGPVRSLRMYFIDWLAPYDASVAHVGGSFNALKEIRSSNYRDLDQFFNAGTYWRSTDRAAPHNVYTSFKNLDALNNAKGYNQSIFTGFSRVDGKASDQPTAGTVHVNFSSALYNTTYTYDKATNSYLRFMGGAPHLDREAGQISPSVVVALRVNMQLVMEDGYREQIDTTGSGDGVVFQNGTAQQITWHKAARTAPITLTDQNGADVPLVRGQTWVAAVPLQGGSISWQ
jgi:hypothetical protein